MPSSSYKLLLAGNRNVQAMVNVIIRATLQIRQDLDSPEATFRQVHIFHTEESLLALMSSRSKWQEALQAFKVHPTSFVHHMTKLEDSTEERFIELMEQLKSIVNPLDGGSFYIDLTGGVSSLKTILAVFAYVLDIENIYSLEVEFSNDRAERARQSDLFYAELVKENVNITYRRFPAIRQFDDFGKLNYTEVLRHRQLVNELVHGLKALIPEGFDLEHLSASLLSAVNSRLMGEVTGESYNQRHAVFSSSAGIEEAANILLMIANNQDSLQGTLGQKLENVRQMYERTPKYFFNSETFEHLTRLMAAIRNDVVHPTHTRSQNSELAAIQAQLSSQLSITFLRFVVSTIAAFLDRNGQLVEIDQLDPTLGELPEVDYYFGFDGDATGHYMEVAFGESDDDEAEVLHRSQTVHKALQDLKKCVQRATKDSKAVLFAEGDNILFKSKYIPSLLEEMQFLYRERTGLYSSIGYGQSLKEATIALRLAKANIGDSIVGIRFRNTSTHST